MPKLTLCYRATLFTLCCIACSALANSAAMPVLNVKYIGNNHQVSEQYYLDVIDAALAATRDSHGDYRLEFTQEDLTSERKHELLIAGEKLNIDRLVGFPLAKGPRVKLLRVQRPILKGAMGYRVLLIHKNKQAQFDQVASLEALSKMPMGFGRGWEGHVYSHNEFTVVETLNMTSLLKMLAGQRYAFVPLSIIEIEDNYLLDGERASNLVIEKNLLLYMPLPVYFYVSPNAPELAERLDIGLAELHKTGELDKLFQQHFGARLARLKLTARRIITLENPEKTSDFPEPNHQWLKNF